MRSIGRLQRWYRQQRGVSLVVVVFTMMILAILGWTLANFIAGDFESNIRNLESEQALYLAEAGIQEALGRLNVGDELFDNDTEFLHRRLMYGEYNVTRDSTSGNVNITSRGYVPGQDGYRALRQVRVVAISGGIMNAVSGGELFDWHNVSLNSIHIKVDIVAANFEGNDGGFQLNDTADLTIPDTAYNRTRSTVALPAIDMDWYRDHADVYEPGDKTFTKTENNAGIIFVEGNVFIDLFTIKKGAEEANNILFQKTSIIAGGDILIRGNGTLDMTTHVYHEGKDDERTFPNLATQNGDITLTCTTCSRHSFDGLIYSQHGVVDLNRIDRTQNTALAARIVRLRGTIEFDCEGKKQSKYININNGFNAPGNATAIQWREE